MTSKLKWFAGITAKNWFGGVKGLLMEPVDDKTGEKEEVRIVPLQSALKSVFDELDALRKQTRADQILIASIGTEMEERQAEVKQLRAQLHREVPSWVDRTLVEFDEARHKLHHGGLVTEVPDLFPTEFRSILDSVARRHSGGPVTAPMLKSMLFGEQASERMVPCPPSDMFPLRAGPGVTVNLQVTADDAGALAMKVAELAASRFTSARDK